jgi:site-specific DNA recombinase
VTSSLRIVGYIRCSSTEQATDGLSLEAQRARIALWCEATEAHLVEVVEDAGVSGTRALADRPGGARIAGLLDARRPAVDAVAIVRLDRLGRDAAETLLYLRRFARGSVGLVSIVDQVDLTTPQGRAMAQLGAVFAELERALIGQRTSEALQALRVSGRVYGPVPYGFAARTGELVEHADEQAVLRRINRLRKRGLSYARIAAKLNAAATPAKRGGVWHAMSVRSVVLTSARVAEAEAA